MVLFAHAQDTTHVAKIIFQVHISLLYMKTFSELLDLMYCFFPLYIYYSGTVVEREFGENNDKN